MKSAQQLTEAFYQDLSEDLSQMVRGDDQILGWINDARTRVGFYVPKTVALTWDEDDWTVDLPEDFCEFADLKADDDTIIPSYSIWENSKLRFDSKATADGGATLFYGADPPRISATQDSVFPDNLDQACVAYALYRFFKWLATSRADYRRYSTLMQGNATDVATLLQTAAGYRADYIESMGSTKLAPPVTFFGN